MHSYEWQIYHQPSSLQQLHRARQWFGSTKSEYYTPIGQWLVGIRKYIFQCCYKTTT